MTLAFADTDCPALPRGVRVVEDRVRGGQVLLGPEKAVALDAIGQAILARVDGRTPLSGIVADLAAAYEAPVARVDEDVRRFLTGLRARMFVVVARA